MWIDWYEGRLTGKPRHPTLELEMVTMAEGDWKKSQVMPAPPLLIRDKNQTNDRTKRTLNRQQSENIRSPSVLPESSGNTLKRWPAILRQDP